MVYRGKPSASCERCRSRRLKCDQGVPTCSSCVRAKVLCPGYRNRLDLGFRDQNAEVIRRSQRTAKKGSVTSGRSRDTAEDATVSAPEVQLPTSAPQFPVQELAKGYFFCQYMSGSPYSGHSGHMSYLLPLVNGPQSSAINAALNAVGLAALSNIRMSPRMMLKARQEYTVALSQTNHALKDPVLSKRDDTLAAVVLLGMFEVVTCTDDSFIERWIKHMEGASKLIEFRGREQLSRDEGLDMFTQLRAQISISKIYQEKYISTAFSDIATEIKQYRSPNDHILDDLGLIVIRLSNFYAALKDKSITGISEIIRAALTIDAELLALFIHVPESWNYKTVKVPTVNREPISRLIWGEEYHVYRSIAASAMWNNYRSARIILNELIIETLNDLDSLATDDTSRQQRQSSVERSRQAVIQLVHDICASVPFHLGAGSEDIGDSSTPVTVPDTMSPFDISNWSPDFGLTPPATVPGVAELHPPLSSQDSACSPQNTSSSNQSFGICGSKSTTPFQITGAGGLTVMWPLLIAANCGLASDELRQWITSCLEKIGHSMGINQALAMADLVRRGMDTRAWLTPESGSPDFNV